MAQQSQTPALPLTQSSLVFAEITVPFPIDGKKASDLKQAIVQMRHTPGTLGSITHIVPIISTTTASGGKQQVPATFSRFMHGLGVVMPDELMRALGDDFFFGLHSVDKNAPVLVIPVVSYDHAFSGMLAWENTMNAELAPVFTAAPQYIEGQNGLPTQRLFESLVMRNIDVRSLKDDSGQIVLYYSFPTQKLLIIAESPYSFAEILSRLQAGRHL